MPIDPLGDLAVELGRLRADVLPVGDAFDTGHQANAAHITDQR